MSPMTMLSDLQGRNCQVAHPRNLKKSMAGSVLSRGGNSKKKIRDAKRTLHKGSASSDEMRLSRKIQQDNND